MVLDNISDKPKKLLLIAVDFPPVSGGISVFIYNLWRYFPSDRIVVLAPFHEGGRSFDIKQNFTIYRTKKERRNSLIGKMLTVFDLFLETKKVIKKERIKEVHCLHLNSTALIGYFLKIFRGIDYYVYVFGAEFGKHRNLNLLQKIILNKAKMLIANSEFTKDVVIKEGIRNKNLIKVYPGVDLERYKPGLDFREIVKRYNLQGKKVIFTVSRLAPNKGFDTAIKVLPEVLRKIPTAVYIIGGTGPCEKELKELASQMNLENKVIFTGFIPDEELPLYYNLCDVFLLLTREIKRKGNVEGFGMVFIEANACGKPVIGGRTGGTLDAIVDGRTGFLVDPLNLEEISEKLIELLTNDDLAKTLGEEGRKRAVKDFYWQKISKEFWKLINS